VQEVYTAENQWRKAVVYLTPKGHYSVAHYIHGLYILNNDYATTHRRSAEVAADNFVKFNRIGDYKLKLNKRSN
jgi:hypothetical protein